MVWNYIFCYQKTFYPISGSPDIAADSERREGIAKLVPMIPISYKMETYSSWSFKSSPGYLY